MAQEGILIVFSGFSGAGKGTIMKELLKRYPDTYALSVSATTRAPRPGETEGIEYFFKTREEFEKMIEKQELIEYARYVENYYGTPKAYVEEQLLKGKDVILEIEIQGALNIKKMFPRALLLFVATCDAKTLKERLLGRGTETLDVIHARLKRAGEESQGMENYDYLVVNEDLEHTVEQVHSIICNEHKRVSHNLDFIARIREDLEGCLKGE